MDGGAFLFFFVFSLIILGTILAAYLYGHPPDDNQKTAWKALAEAHHLTFVSSAAERWRAGGAYVHGMYRGCPLMLESFKQKGERKKVDNYTRITVFPDPASPETAAVENTPLGPPLSVKGLIRALTPKLPSLKGEIRVEEWGSLFVYEQKGLETNQNSLKTLFNLLTDLARNYPEVLTLGGEAVPALLRLAEDEKSPLQTVAYRLLHDIETETREWLAGDLYSQFCPRCLTGCAEHEVKSSWLSEINYYGCRSCGQSRQFLEGPVVAVLDGRMKGDVITPAGTEESQPGIRGNWLERRALFDFDSVEIVQATDEEVERFAVQVGNDTDERRKPRYSEMACTVSAECRLSENTVRILRRTFGEVIVKE